MAEFPIFKGSWPWPSPWIGSYCMPSCITHRPLPTQQISLKSKKLFVDGRTGGQTLTQMSVRPSVRPQKVSRLWEVDLINWVSNDLRPSLLGRLWGVDLKMIGIMYKCNDGCRLRWIGTMWYTVSAAIKGDALVGLKGLWRRPTTVNYECEFVRMKSWNENWNLCYSCCI